MMRVLRRSDYRVVKWKNGLGETAEIAIHPATADLANFEWRLSMARVATGGPFSVFPAIDRHLAILSGDGIALTLGDQAPIKLTQDTPPLAFPGDVPASAELLGRPVTDLNAMARRGLGYTPSMMRLDLDGETTIDKTTRFLLIHCATGATDTLGTGDTLIVETGPAILRGTARLYVITF
ncbi:MAG: HutD family protein [Alphaproteobacteria bacterium]|nr:HutD family protein [Alphaproteobacteria bacterium]